MSIDTHTPTAGWYPDPTERHERRFFDGEHWTDRAEAHGEENDDPIPADARDFLPPPHGAPESGALVKATPAADWYPDPTRHHQRRFFDGEHWTDRAETDDAEVVDALPDDARDLFPQPDVAPPREPGFSDTTVTTTPRSGARFRRRFAIIAVVIAVVAGGLATALVLVGSSSKPSADATYLTNLRKAGQLGQFASNATAIAHGRSVCRKLDQGAKPQGSAADKVAVKSYCGKYLDGFHVLETITVDGTFELRDSSPSYYYSSITALGDSCSGSGGYSDIRSGTTVLVKNGSGKILTETQLGDGSGDEYSCTFPFSFDVKEGEDQYVISVSHRGDLPYSFAQLKTNGVELTLGD
jgi:hypothetical protein